MKLSGNLDHNILDVSCFLVKIKYTTTKTKLDIWYKNVIYELIHLLQFKI